MHCRTSVIPETAVAEPGSGPVATCPQSRPGRGKTHLALALGVGAVKVGRGVYFCTLASEGSLRERMRFLRRPQLLIVDKIGYLPVVPAASAV